MSPDLDGCCLYLVHLMCRPWRWTQGQSLTGRYWRHSTWHGEENETHHLILYLNVCLFSLFPSSS